METKQIVVEFLKLVIVGKIDEAYSKYVDMKGKHHNVYFPKGFYVLRDAMNENEAKFPNKQVTIKNVVCEGDMVAVHSHLAFKLGDSGMITVHLFRIVQGKIVEMWDCGQVIPSDSPNMDGAF